MKRWLEILFAPVPPILTMATALIAMAFVVWRLR